MHFKIRGFYVKSQNQFTSFFFIQTNTNSQSVMRSMDILYPWTPLPTKGDSHPSPLTKHPIRVGCEKAECSRSSVATAVTL